TTNWKRRYCPRPTGLRGESLCSNRDRQRQHQQRLKAAQGQTQARKRRRRSEKARPKYGRMAPFALFFALLFPSEAERPCRQHHIYKDADKTVETLDKRP